MPRMTPGLRWALVVGVEALLIVLLLPFGFVFTGTPGLHQFQLLVLGVAGAAGWIAVIWRPSALSQYLVLAPIPLLAALVVTAFISPYPSLSWPATWVTAAYTGIFWLLALQASHPTGRRNLLAVISMVVILALISFFAAVLLEWKDWLSLGFPITTLPLRPSNTGGLALIPTWLADLVALGSPVVIADLWCRGSRRGAVAFGVVVLAAIVLTGTRSVLLIIAGVSVVAILIVIRGRARRGVVTAVITGVIAIGIVGAVVVLGSTRSFDEGRSSAYASAVARITESPLLGTGPGTFGVERMRDPVDVIGHLAYPDAHNIILNTLAESGLVGLLALLATVTLIGLAIRSSWRASRDDRLIIWGALFGLAIFAGHGMVDVVFGLVGIVIVAIAVVAMAATNTLPVPAVGPRPAYLRATTGVALLIVILISGAVLRTEVTARTVAEADRVLESDAANALTTARLATDSAPDLVPAWWVQMVAADATGDHDAAIAAARKTTELEGFGQQWMSLAILASRQGDTTTARDAIARATDGPPVDPLVELNAVALLAASGDQAGAKTAATRLLEVQPDIERIVRDGPPAMAAVVASARADATASRMAADDPDHALLIALSGEDRSLADALVAQVSTTDPGRADHWRQVIDAWFGDTAARATVDAAARAHPTGDGALWAWRLAGRACDGTAMTFWERAAEIGFSFRPTTPSELIVAPTDEGRELPILYPTFVWKQDHPQRPYVEGTWTYAAGRPICGTS
jgi:O-antigen ligase